MNTPFPDNVINKEIYDRCHNLDVGGITFPLFDSRVASQKSENYFLLSTQLNDQQFTKCGAGWNNSTEIQVIVVSKKNQGSKALLNDATAALIEELKNFALPSASGMTINNVILSVANEIVDTSRPEIVYQKIVRMETLIN